MDYPKLRPGLEAIPVEHEGKSYLLLRDRLGYTDKPVLLQTEFAAFLALLDGRHSVRDIQAFFLRRTGQLIYSERIQEVIHVLDENLFLDNERYAEHVNAETRRFRESPVRRMRHGGKSYPIAPEELRSFLDAVLAMGPSPPHEKAEEAAEGQGRGALPPSKDVAGRGTPCPGLVGLVAPHIDIRAGAATFGAAYNTLRRMEPPEVWVVLGTGHEPIENFFSVTLKDFETPLGLMACDRELAEEIVRRAPQDVLAGELAHSREHTIEFQAVFLAHVQPTARLVPVLCSFDVEHWESQKPVIDQFCDALREAVEKSGKSVGFLASVDLAHIGPRYGDDFHPSRLTIQEHLEADRRVLAALEKPDPELFMTTIVRDGNARKICGVPPLYVFSRVLQGRAEGWVLHHDHAVVDSQGSFVTFAAMAFRGLNLTGD